MNEIKYKPICDIRLYRSNVENIDGNSLPESFASPKLNIIITRLVMKLREKGFSLGDFDHLYINFTTCLEDGVLLPAKRSIDRYHPWFRYYDVGITQDRYFCLPQEDCFDFIIERITALLNRYFCFEENCEVKPCIDEAITKGEEMLMLYKTKQTAAMRAEIHLQMLDHGKYCPNLFVYDQNGTEILHEKLPCTVDFMSLGEILLSKKRVVVKPRKNDLAKDLEPISFEF